MFTPIGELPEEDQRRVIESLDATVEWETTWDFGLADPDDAFGVSPRWGRFEVAGRWPVAFPLGHHGDPRPWRVDCHVPGGHRPPGRRYGADAIAATG